MTKHPLAGKAHIKLIETNDGWSVAVCGEHGQIACAPITPEVSEAFYRAANACEGAMLKSRKHWSQETNPEPLSDAVEALRRKVEAAYYHCDDQAAADAHDDLTTAEWRQRQAEKRK